MNIKKSAVHERAKHLQNTMRTERHVFKEIDHEERSQPAKARQV